MYACAALAHQSGGNVRMPHLRNNESKGAACVAATPCVLYSSCPAPRRKQRTRRRLRQQPRKFRAHHNVVGIYISARARSGRQIEVGFLDACMLGMAAYRCRWHICSERQCVGATYMYVRLCPTTIIAFVSILVVVTCILGNVPW